MRVRELIEKLQGAELDAEVLIASDAEGNELHEVDTIQHHFVRNKFGEGVVFAERPKKGTAAAVAVIIWPQ